MYLFRSRLSLVGSVLARVRIPVQASKRKYENTGSSKKLLFFLNALKKTTEYFLNFLLLFESTILPLNNGK